MANAPTHVMVSVEQHEELAMQVSESIVKQQQMFDTLLKIHSDARQDAKKREEKQEKMLEQIKEEAKKKEEMQDKMFEGMMVLIKEGQARQAKADEENKKQEEKQAKIDEEIKQNEEKQAKIEEEEKEKKKKVDFNRKRYMDSEWIITTHTAKAIKSTLGPFNIPKLASAKTKPQMKKIISENYATLSKTNVFDLAPSNMFFF